MKRSALGGLLLQGCQLSTDSDLNTLTCESALGLKSGNYYRFVHWLTEAQSQGTKVGTHGRSRRKNIGNSKAFLLSL